MNNNIPNEKGNPAKFNHKQDQSQAHRVASRMEGVVKNRGTRPVKKAGKSD